MAKSKAKPLYKRQTLVMEGAEREVKYPNKKVMLHFEGEGGKGPLTADTAMDLMGWVPELGPDDPGYRMYGEDYLVRDRYETKIRCEANLRNRPLQIDNVEKLVQELLHGKWRFNGETVIIDKYGDVHNGQHQLIALIMANQDVERHPDRWGQKWPDGVTMEKVIVLGIEGDDETVNTMDTARPRTFTDVVYRSKVFGKHKEPARKALSRSLEWAVQLLWKRTGHAGMEKKGEASRFHGSFLTHSEGMAFVNTHYRIVECVETIYGLNKGGQDDHPAGVVSEYISPGYAAALMYLMGASDTDPTDYQSAVRLNEATEELVNWSAWDHAKEFWTSLAREHKDFEVLRRFQRPDVTGQGRYIGHIFKRGEGSGSTSERIAQLARAWNHYKDGKPFNKKVLALSYVGNQDGTQTLSVHDDFGGIDIGHLSGRPKDDDKEIKERTAQVKSEKEQAKADGRKGRPKGAATMAEIVAELKDAHPDRMLVFSYEDGSVGLVGEDAAKAAAILKRKARKHQSDGLERLTIDTDDVQEALETLNESGHLLAICDPAQEKGQYEVSYFEQEEDAVGAVAGDGDTSEEPSEENE